MTWTYGGDPSASDKDWVRFKIGDTVGTPTSAQQLSDEEINAMISEEGSKEAAAVACVQALIGMYARLVDKSVGDLSLSYSQRLGQYEALAKKLTATLTMRTAAPIAGGLSASRKRTVEEDTDRVPPFAEQDQFTYPGTELSSDVDDDLT